jgi:hypothetical protein
VRAAHPSRHANTGALSRLVAVGVRVVQQTPNLQSDPGGRIPYRLRVGVTGHRTLPDDQALADRVREALANVLQLAPRSPATEIHLVGVSALAEGADRLVARAVLNEPVATLEAVLPFAPHVYLRDFPSNASKREFDKLLAESEMVTTLLAAGSRTEAFERVGEYVVDRSDVLIAVWDGQPAHGRGGTAEVIGQARQRRMPRLLIATEPPFDIAEELEGGISRAGLDQLDAYNRMPLDALCIDAEVATRTARLTAAAARAGLPPTRLAPHCAWLLPYLVRASLLARRHQDGYMLLGVAQFLLAALAVAVVAAQLLFFPSHPQLAWIEVVLMLILVAALLRGRRQRLLERWISSRSLAERFRSALFLALAGVGTGRERSAERVYMSFSADDWLARAFDEVWGRRPPPLPEEPNSDALARFLDAAWIEDQLDFHRRASHHHHLRHTWLTRAAWSLFAITLVAALLHALRLTEALGTSAVELKNAVILVSLALPALAGALAGIDAHREHHRHAERYRRIIPLLERLQHRLARAPDAAAVRRVASDAADLMFSEGRDWFGVMDPHREPHPG